MSIRSVPSKRQWQTQLHADHAEFTDPLRGSSSANGALRQKRADYNELGLYGSTELALLMYPLRVSASQSTTSTPHFTISSREDLSKQPSSQPNYHNPFEHCKYTGRLHVSNPLNMADRHRHQGKASYPYIFQHFTNQNRQR